MDAKQQIKEHLLIEGKTLTGVVNMLNAFKTPNEQTTVQNISNKLTRGTIKYNEVLEIAQILGYNIVWKKQASSEINLSAFKFEDIINNSNQNNMASRLKGVERNILIEQEVQKFYSNLLILLTNYTFPDNLQEYLTRFLGKASINLNSIPLYSFIFEHSNFLNEALSHTTLGNEFIPMITYLSNIYYQGGIAILQEYDKQNLINSFEYFYDKYFSNNNKKTSK